MYHIYIVKYCYIVIYMICDGPNLIIFQIYIEISWV